MHSDLILIYLYNVHLIYIVIYYITVIEHYIILVNEYTHIY